MAIDEQRRLRSAVNASVIVLRSDRKGVPRGRGRASQVRSRQTRGSAIMERMTTATRLSINRENALRSTGPRTSEGRAVSSRNATQHGLASEHHAVLPHESSEKFDALLADLFDDLEPVGVVEELLCRQVAEASWRVRRAALYEATVLIAEGADADGVGMAVWRDAQHGKGNVLQSVARYGAAAERSRLSALHELERRQAIRRGAVVAPPSVVEVNVTSVPSGKE